MQGTFLSIPLLIPGTLTANVTYRCQAPFNMQLLRVNAGCDNGTSFILDIGTTSDDDAFLDAVTVTGAAASTSEYDRDDFVDGQYPHIADGDELLLTIDYDGGAGGDAANVSVTLWLSEG